MVEEQENAKISKYNAALSQLYRLDSIWQHCHENRRLGRLKMWNIDLDCVWTELASTAKTKENEEFSKYQKLLIKNKDNPSFTNQILMQKEIFLRKLQNRQGKGDAYADEDEDLM